jgi:hypothetical protein
LPGPSGGWGQEKGYEPRVFMVSVALAALYRPDPSAAHFSNYVRGHAMWDFACHYPGYAFCVLGMICLTAYGLWSRAMKTLAVRKSGWPPAHLDANGNFRDRPAFDNNDDF